VYDRGDHNAAGASHSCGWCRLFVKIIFRKKDMSLALNSIVKDFFKELRPITS